jgi:type III secretory pathway component EscT
MTELISSWNYYPVIFLRAKQTKPKTSEKPKNNHRQQNTQALFFFFFKGGLKGALSVLLVSYVYIPEGSQQQSFSLYYLVQKQFLFPV